MSDDKPLTAEDVRRIVREENALFAEFLVSLLEVPIQAAREHWPTIEVPVVMRRIVEAKIERMRK